MESKKLPVLWIDGELVHAENWPLYDYSVRATTKPYQSCREPYIPVARVRELMNEYGMRGEATVVGLLKTLIADVEEHEG